MTLPTDFAKQRLEAERRVKEMNRIYNEKLVNSVEKGQDNIIKKENVKKVDKDMLLILAILLLISGDNKNSYLSLALLYIIF